MPSFVFCNVEHKLEIVDDKSTTFRSEHKFSVVANTPSRFFVRQYQWTGSTVENEKPPDVISSIDQWGFPIQRIHGPLITEGVSRTIVVDLGRTINAGEKVDIHFMHKMKDLRSTFKPKLDAAPERHIRDKLVLCVVTPIWTDFGISYQQYTHDSQKVVETKVVAPRKKDEKLIFKMDISKPSEPNMGHRLVWNR